MRASSCDARIARGAQTTRMLVPREFPRQRVLTATAADDKNLSRRPGKFNALSGLRRMYPAVTGVDCG